MTTPMSDALKTELAEEVLGLVTDSSAGMTAAELFAKSKLAETEQQISGALYRLVNLRKLIKGSDKIFRTAAHINAIPLPAKSSSAAGSKPAQKRRGRPPKPRPAEPAAKPPAKVSPGTQPAYREFHPPEPPSQEPPPATRAMVECLDSVQDRASKELAKYIERLGNPMLWRLWLLHEAAGHAARAAAERCEP